MPACRPYGVSLTSRIASSRFEKVLIATTGPKTSQHDIRADLGTFRKTAGVTVARVRLPPVRSFAPCCTASSIQATTRSASDSEINDAISGFIFERMADLQLFRSSDKPCDEFRSDVLVHIDALYRDANLAAIEERARNRALQSEAHVSVPIDDEAGISAELERDALQAGIRADLLADSDAAGECDHPDARV